MSWLLLSCMAGSTHILVGIVFSYPKGIVDLFDDYNRFWYLQNKKISW